MTQPTTKDQGGQRPPIPHLVDIRTVAEYLGVNVRYVRRLVADREIPFIKWRHLLRFDLDVIARWVDQNRHGEEGFGPRPG
jgi:excisionase family DNA binding protein